MLFEKEKKERRKQKRYTVAGGAFALLIYDGVEVLGSINDISAGGLCLSHIDNDEDIADLSRITINLISEKICHENLVGRNIWSAKEDGGYTSTMVNMKRRGIGFAHLNEAMQFQLKKFIAAFYNL